MTDLNTPPEAPGSHAEASEATPEVDNTRGTGSEPQNGDETAIPANREARYRVERNQARNERDALARRVELLQTRELERLASKALSNPADLLTLSGKTLEDFIGDDGELDADLIDEAANEVLGTRPGLRRGVPAVDRSQGLHDDTRRTNPTFSDLLQAGLSNR